MSSYEKYNQAISEEKQIQEIEKDIRPQVEQQLQEVESSETSYNKNLRQAVISNQNVDLRQASEDKRQFSAIKSQVSEPLRQIEKEKQRVAQTKASAVKTFEQLEAQGYTKEVRGGKVIFYKEDTYSRKKGDKRSYRKEEYIFSSDGTPIEIIKRDDYRDGDKRRVDEEEIVQFDSQGRVSQVRTYNDGEKDERVSYSFGSDGSMSIKTRDYEKERRLEAKAQKELDVKLAEERKYKNITASVDWAGNSEYTETAYNEKTGQWEKTTTTYTKQTPTRSSSKTSTTKTLQATKVPIASEALKVSSLEDLGLTAGVPGVNQGTDTSNIPKVNIKTQKQIEIENQITQGVRENLDLSNPESVRIVQTQTSTPEQIKAQRDIEATAITGRTVVFGFDAPKGDEVNLNPARILVAPYQMGSAIGDYLAENVKGNKNIVEDTKQVFNKVVDDGFVKTTKNVVVGTLEKVSTDPFGFVGETLAFEGAGRVASAGTRNVASRIRPATITESPATIRTALVDDVIKTETSGSFQVEQGLIKRTKQDYTFESTGNLERVKSFETPGASSVDDLKTISETKTQRLSDKPSNTPQTPKQITQQSASREIGFADVDVKVSGAPAQETASVATAQVEREIFRGEIQTVVKDSKGNIVRTQNLPAELVREGQKQTLFVDGKPFDIKQQIIDTPKGVAVDDLGQGVSAFREEGAFGLSNKRQTIQTTATDLESGSQRVALTQQVLDEDLNLFSGSQKDFSRPQRQIGQQRQNLLSDKPQTPGEFVKIKGEIVESNIGKDLTIKETRTKSSRSSKNQGAQDIDAKLFEGVSMKAEPEKVSISKPEQVIRDTTATERANNQIGFTETLDELENPIKQLETPGTSFNREFETRAKRTQLESQAMREERQVAEVFGQDFVDKAKNTKRVDLGQDPFDSSDMFKTNSQGQFEQVFAEQTQTSTKTTKSVVESQKPKAPSSKGQTQEMIFDEPILETKTRKEIKIDQDIPAIDASLGSDFSGLSQGAKVRPVVPAFSFDQGSLFNLSPAVASAQDIGQGQQPAQDTGFDQIFKQDTITETITATDQSFKIDTKQETSQRTVQDTGFDVNIVPPVIPNFTGDPLNPKKQKDSKNIPDPFSNNKKRTGKHKGQFAGSLTALVQGIEIDKVDPGKKVTGFEKRAILRGRGF